MTKRTTPNKRNAPSTWLIGAIVLAALAAIALFAGRERLFASAATPAATSTPARAVVLTPTLFEYSIGSVTVRDSGVSGIYLFAEPNPNAEKLGEIAVGERGELYGQDAGGEWLYVTFGNLSGWAPVYFFDVIILQ